RKLTFDTAKPMENRRSRLRICRPLWSSNGLHCQPGFTTTHITPGSVHAAGSWADALHVQADAINSGARRNVERLAVVIAPIAVARIERQDNCSEMFSFG